MPDNNLHLRSEEIQEIIGQIPPWIIRWGTTVLLSVLMIVIFCSFYVKFPDVLPANAIISSTDQPFSVSWFKSGPHIHIVYVEEGQNVKAGDTLVVEQSLVNGKMDAVISPVGGRIIIFKGTEDNPRKSTIIVHPEISHLKTELYLLPKGSGKVREGQKVLIKLDAYPTEEFGMLEGKIISVLPVPIKGKYRAEVALLNGLMTTENKELPPQHALTGNAEIVLDDESLFDRIFGTLF